MIARSVRMMVIAVLAAAPILAAGPRVLFLSKSSTFQHPAIQRRGDEPSHVERVLEKVAREADFELETTKDAGRIRADVLTDVDVVVFYTTGDLRVEGSGSGLFGGDGYPGMGEHGLEELIAWVEAGGALVGYHSASDTFHGADGEVSPYIALLGGEFATHGRQFEGRLRVVDPRHPLTRAIPAGWVVEDEWYVLKNYDVEAIHVLALLETASDPHDQAIYDRGDYPVMWCAARASGRVFYNAMGHREDVWDRPEFQAAFVDAVRWASGEGPGCPPPNYDRVVTGAAR